MNKLELLTEEDLESALNEFYKKVESLIEDKIENQRKWLTTELAAEYLNVSRSQIHKLKGKGILPCSKISGTNYFKRSEIDQLLEENKQF